MSEYILFSLANGAELVGEVVMRDATRNSFTVSQPLVIRPVQRGPNDFALDLFPHSLANPEGDHEFYASQVVSTSTTVPPHLEKAYVERTSKLILATHLDNLERMS